MRSELSRARRRELLRAALAMTAKTGALIRRRLARGPRVRVKKDGSYVTDADLAAEQLLRAEIIRRFPDHGIQGEEFGARNSKSDFQWLLDPIDGTLSFTRGIPLFGTIVGLFWRGKPLLGVIDHPALGETYAAAAGLGASRNGKPLKLAAPRASIDDELVAVCYRDQFLRCGKQAVFDRLMKSHPQVRTYGDCFGHTLAAEGAVGAMVDYDINPWDLAATQILIEEAGGKYVRLGGRTLPGGKQRFNIMFGKPKVVDWLLKVLK